MRTKKPVDPLDQLIGRNVRFYRIRKGLSQTALGEGIGVTFQQVQKYENTANRVPGSRLVHIAGVLGVPVDALYRDEAGPTPENAHGKQAHRLANANGALPLVVMK